MRANHDKSLATQLAVEVDREGPGYATSRVSFGAFTRDHGQRLSTRSESAVRFQ